MLPESGRLKPAIAISNVVFPEPEGPSNVKNSPALISILTQYRANNNIDAFWVKDMFLTDTDTKIKRVNPGSAHITLSLKDGFKPGDANSMFKKPKIKKNIIGYVEGKINYIKLN